MSLSWQHLLAFLFAVGLLVTVHEFGHYWVARRLGFKVLRFSVGFGKPLFRRVAGTDQTEYVLAAIPLGGYVKLLDEREAPVVRADADGRGAVARQDEGREVLALVAPGGEVGPHEELLLADGGADVEAAAQEYRASFAATESLHRAGLASLIDLEDQRRAVLAAETALVTLRRERVAAGIALYRAVGGGWARPGEAIQTFGQK